MTAPTPVPAALTRADVVQAVRLLRAHGRRHTIRWQDASRDYHGAPEHDGYRVHVWTRAGQEIEWFTLEGDFLNVNFHDKPGDDSFWGIGEGVITRLGGGKLVDRLIGIGALPLRFHSGFAEAIADDLWTATDAAHAAYVATLTTPTTERLLPHSVDADVANTLARLPRRTRKTTGSEAPTNA